jgi:large subunit ribosomal protein L24
MKIQSNDTVLVTAGKDKGKTGKVMLALRSANKVVVEQVNVVVKHIKKTMNRPGERVKLEKPIDTSNVKLICPNCNKPTRVGYTKLTDGKKSRICKKCGKGIANPNAKKSK